jgi:hypothetical protein
MMGPAMHSSDVCDLVLEACDLIERAARGTATGDLLAEAAHLRAALCDAVAACDDPAIWADGRSAICDLDALLDGGDLAPGRPEVDRPRAA